MNDLAGRALTSMHRERYIATNGIRLHAIEAGREEDPLVILLHGFPEFWYGWRKQIDPLAAAGYRILVPDQRGYNESDKPEDVRAYTLDALAADVLGLIDDAGRERAVVVGHDWGAAVAWWCALRYPQRIDRIAVLNVPHPLVMQRHVRRSVSQMAKSWYIAFFQLPRLPETLMHAARGPMFAALRRTGRRDAFDDTDRDAYVRAWSQPGAWTSMLAWYRAAVRFSPRDLGKPVVSAPVLIVWGVRDRFLDFDMAPKSLELCARGRLEAIEEATHWVQHEEPERVNRLLIDFFAEPSSL